MRLSSGLLAALLLGAGEQLNIYAYRPDVEPMRPANPKPKRKFTLADYEIEPDEYLFTDWWVDSRKRRCKRMTRRLNKEFPWRRSFES